MNLKNTIIWNYISLLSQFEPRKLGFVLSLMIFVSLTEGFGLVLLIPLLQLVGLDVQQNVLGEIYTSIYSIFNYLTIQPTLEIVLIIYVFVITLNAILVRLNVIKISEIQYEFSAYLRKNLFKAINQSNWLFFTKKKSSDFAHALTNEIERVSFGTEQFLYLISSLFILIIYLLFATKISGPGTILVFAVGVILLILLKKRTSISSSRGEEITEYTQNIYHTINQHLDGMKTVKSFNMEKKNVFEFSRQVNKLKSIYIHTIQSYANVKLLFDVGSVIILSLIVYSLINLIHVSTAELLILIFLFIRIIPLFSSSQTSYQYLINSLPAFSQIKNLEQECKEAAEIEYDEENLHFQDRIELNNVTFKYHQHDDFFTINNLDIKIAAGKTTALVGLSGAGKSTIADLVMGLIKPFQGKVLIDGDVLNSKNISSWRSQIGYVSQDTFLFNDSVRKNLLFANPRATEQKIWKVLKMAAASEFISKLPHGLDTLIGDRGVTLSGGEKQRLALARALIRDPALLILDEATSNLDTKNEMKILDSIEKLQGNLTIFIIAHRLSTIRDADLIYLIEEGQVVESGHWESLMQKDHGGFKALYQLQS